MFSDLTPHNPTRRTEQTAPPPTRPRLPGRVAMAPTVEQLFENMGEDFVGHSLNCVRSFGDFQLALSDGPILRRFYQHLMIDPSCRAAPWSRSHLWVVDELRVEWNDPDSTWETLGGFFGEHAGIPQNQQHPIPALSDAVEQEYEASLRSVLEWRERGHDRLDYVLLELGEDGSIGSLYPRSPALRETESFVRINSTPSEMVADAVTMTLPFINAARFVGVVVTGESRRPLVERLVAGDEPIDELPARGLNPLGGALTWYLDYPACAPANGEG